MSDDEAIGDAWEPREYDERAMPSLFERTDVMTDHYPERDPSDEGMLDVGEGNQVHWEVYGPPDGKPALYVHGGPGSGSNHGITQYFDPERYRVVLFDQRGCGLSTPPASDPETDMTHNTTDHLVADMELLRQHLGIDRWLLFGGSWGSTLALAYAEAYPDRVTEMVISPVTTTRRSEIHWLYGGVSRFVPEAWERFRAGVPEADGDGDIDDILAAYARRMASDDPEVRSDAANEWCAWEDAVLAHETDGDEGPYSSKSMAWKRSFVRIASHYFSNGAWLDEGQLIEDAERLSGIPGVLVHGRLDLGGPLNTAWELERVWPDAELHVVEESGHVASEQTSTLVREALDEFTEQ